MATKRRKRRKSSEDQKPFRVFSCLFAAKFSGDCLTDGHKGSEFFNPLFVSLCASSRLIFPTGLMATRRRKSHKDKPDPCSPSDRINFFT
jgi:hypothetical protein